MTLTFYTSLTNPVKVRNSRHYLSSSRKKKKKVVIQKVSDSGYTKKRMERRDKVDFPFFFSLICCLPEKQIVNVQRNLLTEKQVNRTNREGHNTTIGFVRF